MWNLNQLSWKQRLEEGLPDTVTERRHEVGQWVQSGGKGSSGPQEHAIVSKGETGFGFWRQGLEINLNPSWT